MASGLSPESLNKVLGVLGITLLALATCFVVIVGSQVFLLFFAAVLFAVFLRHTGGFIQRWSGISRRWSVVVVLCALVTLTTLLATAFAVNLINQLEILIAEVEDAVSTLLAELQESTWIEWNGQAVPNLGNLISSGTFALGNITRALSSTVGFILSILIVFVVGILLAVHAEWYRGGIMALFPPRARARADEILDRIAHNLWLWLGGRLVSMAIIGIMTATVLVVLGIPMPILLGLIAALLTFIPNIGAVLAILLPALLALQQGIGTVLIVVGAYSLIQIIESYAVTPMVQQRITRLPAALVILSQILGGILFGFLGLALAEPMMLVLIIVIEELYVNPMSAHEGAPSEERGR